MGRYIGLDVAYRNVGVVILDDAGVLLSSKHLKCGADTDPSGFAWHREQADGLFLPDDVVAIEGLSFGSIGKTHVLAGAHAMWITAAVRDTAWVYVPVPARVKLWAVESVGATKAQMKAWARDELGALAPVKLSEHEADALSLAQIARAADLIRMGEPVILSETRAKLFRQPKGTGLLDVPGRSFYQGHHGSQGKAA